MKPGDFLLGVFEFFAVLLPGSLATWLAAQYLPDTVVKEALTFGVETSQAPDAVVLATALLASSYILGHFVFMIGAQLDGSYDRWRRRVKPLERDNRTFDAAEELYKTLNPQLVGGDFTVLKWAKVYIQVHAQHARAEIDRLEADHKFFRGLVVISAALAGHFLLRAAAPAAAVVSILMAILAYRRYLEQRWKMSELIYATVVIVHAAESARGSAAQGSVRCRVRRS